MDRHIELTQMAADLSKKMAEAEALTKAPDAEARRTGVRLLNELTPKHAEAMSELRTVVIAHSEKLKLEMENQPKREWIRNHALRSSALATRPELR